MELFDIVHFDICATITLMVAFLTYHVYHDGYSTARVLRKVFVKHLGMKVTVLALSALVYTIPNDSLGWWVCGLWVLNVIMYIKIMDKIR